MSDYLFGFEKLHVWGEVRKLIKDIYLCCKSFPKEELFGLTSQLKRATISIGSNIAEGSARKSKKDQAYFYTMAYSSLMEVLAQIIMAKDLNMLTDEQYSNIRSQIESISRMINSLRNSINP